VFTVLPAPLLRRYGKLPAITALVQGVTAAAIGAIAGAVLVLGRRSLGLRPDHRRCGGRHIRAAVLRKTSLPEPVVVLHLCA
jgi:chromate transporter